MELARRQSKPVILHLVRAQNEAIQILNSFGHVQCGGFVHSFSGGIQQASEYLKRNFLISVGTAVLDKNNKKLRQCITEISMNSLILESDAPDQAPDGDQSFNESVVLWDIAQEIAQIRGGAAEDVLISSRNNLVELFHLQKRVGFSIE